MKTRYGNAKINKDGYYVISTGKEGNNGKLLHRLIARDYFGDWIDEPDPNGDKWAIHHIDGDKTNNCVLNLEPMPFRDHRRLHSTGENNPNYGNPNNYHHSDETRKKISESHKGEKHWNYGKTHSEETRKKMSMTRNTSGYLNVSKRINKECKQGFTWVYRYSEDGKQKAISSVDIEKLKSKVKARGFPWKKLKEE